MSNCLADARKASATARCASPATRPRAPCKASTAFFNLVSKGASLTLSLNMSRLASTKGPFSTFLISFIFSFITLSRALETSASAATRATVASSITCSGLSSPEGVATKASAVAAAFSACSAAASQRIVASSTMVAARTFSATSSLLAFSFSNCSAWPFCASAIFFFNVECEVCALLARTRIFMSSAFASPRGPRLLFLLKSSALVLSMAIVSFTASSSSCSESSIFRVQAS
mmetsp:Transcript_6676/g.24976  ORF Transcript_6676/g.24976 Transcript_6676/m.24976 type:complete len:232 (+) Transcript_6676:1543-2238(+)